MNLDNTDWKIITELEQDARISYVELGRRVGLSSPAAQERVRKLEDAGIITGYQATVDYSRLGLPIRAVIRLDGNCRDSDMILEKIREIPNVIDCYHVLGDDCFHIVVAATSTEHLKAVIQLMYPYGQTSTTMILETPIRNRPITPDALVPMKE